MGRKPLSWAGSTVGISLVVALCFARSREPMRPVCGLGTILEQLPLEAGVQPASPTGGLASEGPYWVVNTVPLVPVV